jgi:hypothetical protein
MLGDKMVGRGLGGFLMETKVYISRVDTPEGRRDYVSLLPPENGLITASIIGMFRAPESGPPVISQETFARNGVFVDLLHAVIRREAPKLSAYLDEARHVRNGPVYVIDRRAAEDSTVQPEDVFGVFEARNHQIMPDFYEPNPTHRLLSDRGFFQLETELHAALMQELTALASHKK